MALALVLIVLAGGAHCANVDRCAQAILPLRLPMVNVVTSVYLDTSGVEGNNSCLFFRTDPGGVTWPVARAGCLAIPNARLLTAVRRRACAFVSLLSHKSKLALRRRFKFECGCCCTHLACSIVSPMCGGVRLIG